MTTSPPYVKLQHDLTEKYPLHFGKAAVLISGTLEPYRVCESGGRDGGRGGGG